MKNILLILITSLSFSGMVEADCGGLPTSGRARTRQPVRNFFQKLRGSNVSQQASSCAGSLDTMTYQTASVDCTQLVQTVQPVQTVSYAQPVQTVTYAQVAQCVTCTPQVTVQQTSTPCTCVDCTCVPETTVSYQVEQRNCTFGLVPQTVVQQQVVEQNTFGLTEAYSRAYQSAAYRAANGIKGHVRGELLSGQALRRAGSSKAGVGFASDDPKPMTCLGKPGRTNATCAVVRGSDGWYATCVKP